MRWTLVFFLLVFILSSCAAKTPGADQVGTAIAQTQAAIPTDTSEPTIAPTKTRLPTYTPKPTKTTGPTATKRPTATNKPTKTVVPGGDVSVRDAFVEINLEFIKSLSEVETVNLVRFEGDTLVVELKTKWASKDHQPDVSYDIIKNLAEGMASALTLDDIYSMFGISDLKIKLVTYSTDGDYRYESITNFDTLSKIYKSQLSYDEWVVASGAGFK